MESSPPNPSNFWANDSIPKTKANSKMNKKCFIVEFLDIGF
jgi:hypothetical protein